MSKPKIILIGAGGHCRSCIDVIELEDRFEIAGVVDRPESPEASSILGYPFLGTDDDLSELRKTYDYAFITVGQIKSPSVRIRLYETLVSMGFELPVIISPRAHASRHSTIGRGSIIMHDALINAGASIGQNCIINSKALIEHDAQINDHCHISTAAVINGGVVVGSGTFFGSNATTVHCSGIPNHSFVRAGSLERGE